MKKRILSLLLCLVLCLSMLPGMSAPALAADHPALTVTKSDGSTAFETTDYSWDTINPNMLVIMDDGLTVSSSGNAVEGRIVVQSNVDDLTIQDLNLTCTTDDCDAIEFYTTGNSELILKGTNTVKATGEGNPCNGINSCGSLTVSGDGNLTATSVNLNGIRSNGNLTFSGSGTMRFDGALAGIYADGSGNITVSATVSTIISYGNNERFSGVSWNSGTLSLASGVTMTADADYRKDADSITGAAFADDEDACVKAGSSAGAPAAKSVLIVGVKNYNVWVNNVQFTSANATTGINCGSGTATLDTSTTPYTLTLTDAIITNAHEESYASAAVFTENALKVVLVGTNIITATDTGKSGFYAEDVNLTLEGEGSLTVSAKDSGIYMSGTAAKTVTLGGSGKLEITGESAGIYSEKGVTVVFSNMNSTPVSIVASDEYGIWSVDGDITLSGTGNANITAVNTAVYVFDTGDVTFSGSGNLALEGGHGVDSTANGIYVQNGDVNFSGEGGQVSVEGDGDAIYLGASGKKVYLNGSASPITLTAGAGCCAVNVFSDGSTNVVTDTNAAYNVEGGPATTSAVYTLKIPTYTVTVQNDGNGSASADKTSAAKGETVTLTATPAAGYHFKEWQSSDVTVSGNTFTMPEKNVTVKAIFEENTYTVTFDPNGGSVIPTSGTTDEDGKLASLPTPTRYGYTFDGWYTAASGGVEVTIEKVYTADTTIYARWTKDKPSFDPTHLFILDDEPVAKMSFRDVQRGAYYYDAVKWAVENGITTGKTSTEFDPTGAVTRAQAVTFLWRAAGCPKVNYFMKFTDLKPGAYYTEAVRWAVAEGITKGTTDTSFSPDASVTRGQIMTFLYRYSKQNVRVGSNPFTDVAADAYYNDAVLWAVANGITGGTSATTFAPSNGCTRGQVVTFLYRYMVK